METQTNKYNYRVPEGHSVIFRAWRKTKDGTILWAKSYGKKAWRIVLKDGVEVLQETSNKQ